jgi:K+-sensing histidine kinase KdpD
VWRRAFGARWHRLAETVLMVAASTLVGLMIAPRWGNAPIVLLYLPAVLGAAVLYGLCPRCSPPSPRRSRMTSSSPSRTTRC